MAVGLMQVILMNAGIINYLNKTMFEENKKQLSGNKGPIEDILADTDNSPSHNIEDSLKNAVPVENPIPEPQSLKETPVVPTMQQKSELETPPIKPESAEIKTAPVMPEIPQQQRPARNKTFLIVIIVFFVIILSLASVFAFQYFTQNKVDELDKNSEESFQELLDVLDETDLEVEEETEDELYFEKDSDGDGLTDSVENQLGTNPQSFDTDNDGLNDFEEIQIYFSDPIKPDTDQDGYLDGEEVQNGYSPLKGDKAKL